MTSRTLPTNLRLANGSIEAGLSFEIDGSPVIAWR